GRHGHRRVLVAGCGHGLRGCWLSHSYRSASIGFSDAARLAGYRPKKTPTASAKENANRIENGVTTGRKVWYETKLASDPRRMPRIPPNVDNMIASIRNWATMSPLPAPMALRMPIS